MLVSTTPGGNLWVFTPERACACLLCVQAAVACARILHKLQYLAIYSTYAPHFLCGIDLFL